MTTPLLGDPASISALAATLRRTAVRVAADRERVGAARDDAAAGWSGVRSTHVRHRIDLAVSQAAVIAAALDEVGHGLHTAATELAATIADLRTLEDEAAAAGLEVRDGTVTKGWGITGVADSDAVEDSARLREHLQERLHTAVTALGRHRARSSAECVRAARLLNDAAAKLRR